MKVWKSILYEFKIIYAPIKWFICAFFVILIPFVFYTPTRIDVINLSEIYVPLIGIVLFSDIMLFEQMYHADEVVYLGRRKRASSLFIRFFIMMLILAASLWISVLLTNAGLTLMLEEGDSNRIHYLDMLCIVVPGSLFVGSLGMTFANLLSSTSIGYLIALVYWAYWMISTSMDQINLLNLFSFANGYSYSTSKMLLVSCVLGLLILNMVVLEWSPLQRRMRLSRKKRRNKKRLP
ncbi:hypothetical protein [Paenibacillus tuaregi]|uniref:hypothetical protein n=1 Tax=Paenibacillus tuaregi TaxID=1816681 RepID=UPI000838F8A1|nr:hypothetical protein [Paenibacillus tuaregi]